MADDRFDAQVRGWLVDRAPVEAPDRILDAVSARIEELDSRRARWPRFAVIAPAFAVAIVVLAVAVGLWLNVVRVGNPAPPAPSDPPDSTIVDCPSSPCRVQLDSLGAYRTRNFVAPMTFVVEDTRWVLTADNPRRVRLERAADGRQRLTIMSTPDPLAHDAYPAPEAKDAASLAAWLTAHPLLVVANRSDVVIGGLPGTRLDVTGAVRTDIRGQGCTEALGCVELLALDGPLFSISFSDEVRLYILDNDGEALVVAAEARHVAPTETFFPLAEALLASMEFRVAP